MSIWVRTQDKKRLIEVNDFKIEKREVESTPIGAVKSNSFISKNSRYDVEQQAVAYAKKYDVKIINSKTYHRDIYFYCEIDFQKQIHNFVFDIDSGYNTSYTTLGTYATEEKALKILDMIFEAVEQGHNFIMPSDEEQEEQE